MRFGGRMNRAGLVLALAVMIVAALSAAPARPGDRTKGFFPVSVWYAGATARAPMLESGDAALARGLAEGHRPDQVAGIQYGPLLDRVDRLREGGGHATISRPSGRSATWPRKRASRSSSRSTSTPPPTGSGPKYPDSKFVSSNGVAVESQASPGFCFDHDGVREKILGFFSEAAKAVKDKPAFYGWDLWSEPHIINWAEVYYVGDLRYVQFCYCHSTQARFREWLKKKYGSVEALNKAWYRTVKTWDEVEPPRYGTILTFTDYIDWKEFISDKLAEDLALKAAAVKAVLPDTVVTSHSAGPGIFTRPDWSGTPDDRKMSDSVDFYGSSIYPKHAWTIKPWSPFYRSSGLDFVRSMGMGNDGFYIGELQAGYGVFGMKMSYPVVGADLRNWMWSAIAYGARAVNIYAYYPMSTGYEAGGYGLVELDGKVTERAVEAGARSPGSSPRTRTSSSAPCRPRPEIAILYNPLSHMVGGQQSLHRRGPDRGRQQPERIAPGHPQGLLRTEHSGGLPPCQRPGHAPGGRVQAHHRPLSRADVPAARPEAPGLRPRAAGPWSPKPVAAGWTRRACRARSSPAEASTRSSAAASSMLTPIPKTSAVRITTAHESIPLLKPGRQARRPFLRGELRGLRQGERRPGRVRETGGRPWSRRPSERGGPSSSGRSRARPISISRTPTTASSSRAWPIG